MTRTVSDWIESALKAPSPTEREASVAAAMRSARRAWEWRQILKTGHENELLSESELERAIEELVVRSIEEKEIWGFRDAARVLHARGETAAARAVLQRGQETFEPEEPSYLWKILADGYAGTLSDLDGARLCLGRAHPTSLDDRCTLALARASLFDERELAMEALSGLIPSRAQEAWTLGNAWQALGQPAKMEQVFTAVLSGAASLSEHLTIAKAWASHERSADAYRVLDEASPMATTASEQLELAECAFDLGHLALLRQVLETVEAMASLAPLSEEDRTRLIQAWAWIGETEHGAVLGEPGRRPDEMEAPERALPGFVTDPNLLLDWLRERITENQLRDIAGADYGADFDKHLAALSLIKQSGRLPCPLPWEPGEVLRLRRWSEGEKVDHLGRAFCAAILSLCDGELANNAPVLVESAIALGEDAVIRAEALLAWLYSTASEYSDEGQICALWGLAILQASRRRPLSVDLQHQAEVVLAGRTKPFEDICRYSLLVHLWNELSARYLAGSWWEGRLGSGSEG